MPNSIADLPSITADTIDPIPRWALLERQMTDLQTTVAELREIRKLAAERIAQGG